MKPGYLRHRDSAYRSRSIRQRAWRDRLRHIVSAAALVLISMSAAAQDATAPAAGPTPHAASNATDRTALNTAARTAVDRLGFLDSLVVMQHGERLFEFYRHAWDSTRPHEMRSATKNVISAALGIALGEERARSMDQPVFGTLASWLPEAKGARARITFEHVLTMTSGIACNPPNERHDPCDPRQAKSRFPWREFLEAPMRDEPGTHFNYNDAAPGFILAFIYALSKQPPADFIRERLYQPLGFDKDATLGKLAVPDMLNFGQLFLQRGCWNGRQLIPRQWVEISTAAHWIFPDTEGRVGYGYFWWWRKFKWQEREISAILAEGNGGQLIVVIPELDAVLVTTGSAYDRDNAIIDIIHALLREVAPALAAGDSAAQTDGCGTSR